jgi:hypothetical protein
MQLDWITIFDDVAQLISLDRAFNEEQLMLAITSGSWMEPTMYRLLAIRPLHHGANTLLKKSAGLEHYCFYRHSGEYWVNPQYGQQLYPAIFYLSS